MIYIFIFIYTIAVAFIIGKSKNYRIFKSQIRGMVKKKIIIPKNNIYFFLMCMIAFSPMVFLHASRYGFGTDYSGTYKKIFYNVYYGTTKNAESFVESGYVLFNKIIAMFTSDYVWVLFFASIITFSLLIYAICINSQFFADSVVCVFLSGYFLDSTTMVRQIIAITLYMIAVKYVYKRSFVKYLIIIIFASFFHISVLFMIPMYFVYGKRIKKRTLLFLTVGFIVSAKVIFDIVIKIMLLIPKYALYVPAMYTHTHFELVFFVVSFVIFVIIFLCEIDDDKYSYWLLHAVIAVIITSLSGTISFIFRFLDYFLVTTIILYLPEYLHTVKKKYFLCLSSVSYGVLLLFQIYVLYIANWYKAIPYKSIWFR
ncbi:EpsG family protein [Robinsoniella peoriensis]